MDLKRFFRYLAPNLVTACGLVFGMLSIKSSIDGQYYLAAWFVMFCVITDRIDGFVARAVRGTSEFGVQLDSFSDFLSFGVAPATLWYSYFSAAPGLPFSSGWGQVLLLVACGIWLLAVTFRLARYNIVNDDPKCRHIFFGVPTTFAAAWLGSTFLTMIKYAEPAVQELAQADVAGEWLVLGGFEPPRAMWLAFPGVIILGGLMMASTLRIPKLAKRRSKLLTWLLMGSVFFCYIVGVARIYPEALAVVSWAFMALALGYSTLAADARGLKAPPIFPPKDPLPGQEPQRPEEDLVDLIDTPPPTNT
jgi:CDP-diacylglycerol--serine O-phosphatidyltransferase